MLQILQIAAQEGLPQFIADTLEAGFLDSHSLEGLPNGQFPAELLPGLLQDRLRIELYEVKSRFKYFEPRLV